VLCFPYIFRGALDCGATTITREMEIAVVHAIADLAHAEQSDIVATTYGISNLSFGPEYLIPMPFDPRLLIKIAPAVAKAAEDSASPPVRSPTCSLRRQPAAVRLPQRHLHEAAVPGGQEDAAELKRIVYAEGEEERVLRAVQVVVDESWPPDPGRPSGRAGAAHREVRPAPEAGRGLRRHQPGPRRALPRLLADLLRDDQRKGVTQEYAKLEMRRRHTLIGAMMIHKGDADGMICGTFGTTQLHLHYIDQVLGKREGANVYAAMNV
jgi:malate dehydrogenase (oxaloacetate-decarboxylating)(NADP+)